MPSVATLRRTGGTGCAEATDDAQKKRPAATGARRMRAAIMHETPGIGEGGAGLPTVSIPRPAGYSQRAGQAPPAGNPR